MATTTSYKRSLPTIAELRAYTGAISLGMTIEIPGADGGIKGSYLWNSTSTAADNADSVIKVTSRATGRFIKYDKASTISSGTGDLLSANNLSDVASTATARTNLGLANVDNTSDINKPISTATQTALSGKQALLVSGTTIKTINGATLLGSGNITISGGTGGTGDTYNISGLATVLNIDELRGLPAPTVSGQATYVNGYRELNDGGGGIYIWHPTSTLNDDLGGIIKPNSVGVGSPGRYIHAVENGVVNLKWWGIRAFPGTGTAGYDIADLFDAAMAFMRLSSDRKILRIPADEGGFIGSYYVSRTLNITSPVTIIGDGNEYDPRTSLVWDPRVKCIFIPYLYNGAAIRVSMSNFVISQLDEAGDYGDNTGHGIETRTQVQLRNIKVVNVTGNGFHIHACSTPGHGFFGNANFSDFTNCSTFQCLNGMFIRGCDANKMTINKFEATNNRRWGVYDDGFLGNVYNSPHFSANGSTSRDVVVSYGGKIYSAYNVQEEDPINIGKQPDISPLFWRETQNIYSEPWIPTRAYYSGGTIAIINANACGMVFDPYSEDFQPNAILSARTMQLNGTQGSNTWGGVNFRVLFGQAHLIANLIVPLAGSAIGVGGGPALEPRSPLHLYQNFAVTGQSDTATFESGTNEMWINLRNSGDQFGYINYTGNSIRMLPGGTPTLALIPGALIPDTANVTLGTAGLPWSNVHVRKITLPVTGTAATVGTATLSGGTVTVSTTAVQSASKIFLTVKNAGGTQGFLSAPTIVNNTSFTINSTSASETSTVNWWIVN